MAGPLQHTDQIETASSMHNGDKAAVFLKEHELDGPITYTLEEEKAICRKIDLRILPLIVCAYFFQQLDKSSLAYSSVFDITTGAHLHGQQYSWLGSVVYLSELVAQPLAALSLVILPTGKVTAGACLLWGATLCIMSACTTFPSLLGLRLVLGIFESIITPSLVAITQMWWKRSEQTLRTSYWSSMNGATYIIGSLLTFGLGHIHSDKLFSYQIIFLFCGLLTVVYAIPTWFFLADSPMEAKFLTDREKLIAIERLRANQMGIISRKWRWDHVWETLCDLKTWCWFVIITAISIPSGGISTFGSLIIKAFGYNKFQTILFNLPFGVIEIIAIVGGAWLATKIGHKGPVIALLCLPPIAGCITMIKLAHTSENKGILLFAYYLTSVYPAITPLIFAWEAQNTAGDTKRKFTTGVISIGLCAGNVIGPQLYSTDDAPLYHAGLVADLCMFILIVVLVGIITLYIIFLNRRHAKRRQELGKSATVLDMSMLTTHQTPAGEEETVAESGAAVNENAFDDLTDLQNEEFIFVL